MSGNLVKTSRTTRTFWGFPCSRGHHGLRYVSSGSCVDCAAEDARDPVKKALRKAKDPLAVQIAKRKYFSKLRDAAFEKCGGHVCSCCGETIPEVLRITRLDGSQLANGTSLFIDIVRGIGEHKVLCLNCIHWHKKNSGPCPHAPKGTCAI